MRALSPLLLLVATSLTACGQSPAAADASVDAPVDVALDAPTDAPFRCARTRPAPAAPSRCNGSAALCDRRYDQVLYATTHNAMSSEEDRFASPNQRWGLTRQLRDGVRGLMLDVHTWRDAPWLCHGTCLAGSRPFVEGLCELGRYLDADREAVVTILFESYIDAAAMEASFREAGLLEDVHAQAQGAPWPTLRAMVSSGRRLVVFTDRGGGARPWLHDMWQWAQENPFAARTPADLDCRAGRGRASNPLFVFNHFLTNPLASPELARMVNFDPVLSDHLARCERERMRTPNFVSVDFYELGDLLRAVDARNAMPPRP